MRPTIHPIGDKIVVEILPTLKSKYGSIFIPETADHMNQVQEAQVWFIGSKCSEPSLKIDDKVLVKTFTGAEKIVFNDKTLRLYNTADVIAVL